MRSSKWNAACALAVLAFVSAANAQPAAKRPVPDTIEGHLAAGKDAAGGRDNTPDFYGLVTAICVAPKNTPNEDVAPRPNPNRASTYLEPKKVIDDLYWMGTPSRSTWALTTSDGIILYDTQEVYDAEDLIIGGLKKLGLNPSTVKYVIISHAHSGEVGGARLMQERYGSHIVMGAGDWDMVAKSVHGFPNGKPKRDIVATDGMKITLGGRAVTTVSLFIHSLDPVSLLDLKVPPN
jgi:metallo-beta-lactamase class B